MFLVVLDLEHFQFVRLDDVLATKEFTLKVFPFDHP